MWRVLVTDPLADEGLQVLEVPGIELDIRPGLPPEELLKAVDGAHALLVRSGTKVTEAVIQAGCDLKVIGRAGTGVDNIDVAAASRQGVIVMNTPGGNSVAACELTFALLLSLMREVVPANSELRRGQWTRKNHMGRQLQGKALGLLGFGRIGREVALRAQAFGMTVLVSDPFVSAELARESGVQLLDRERVLARADVLSLHLPLTAETRHMIGAQALSSMKEGAVIVNCARGGLVDEDALLDALESGKILGAALDVFEQEPPTHSALVNHPRVVATPHLGASTREAQLHVASEMAHQVVDFLTKGEIRNAVNMPSLSAEVYERAQPYLDLGERLGSMAGQLSGDPYRSVTVTFRGEAMELPRTPVASAVLVGLLGTVEKGIVNYVNARMLAKELNIDVIESAQEEAGDYPGLLEVHVAGAERDSRVAGTVTPAGNLRLARWEGLSLDAPPTGAILALANPDVPGVVGAIATLLGRGNINIAHMSWGRNDQTHEAYTLINLDQTPDPALLEAIDSHDKVLWSRMIQLP